MRTDRINLAFAYLRLSNEESQGGESSSITNQRRIVQDYCRSHGIHLVREFVDDGYSGGNFHRPGFLEMMEQLKQGKANMVITKDLSRLGRDMREASRYAEQVFPEQGIRYIAIGDNFDTEQDNLMAPFTFAMNEVYLRDGSRKVKEVLKSKRENGQYCACPPYGYRKDKTDRNRLAPDENTAPIVSRIFERAAAGDSSRRIAMELNDDGVIPPLKYRVLYRDEFSLEGAARASDLWNNTTVKRILKNRVYLGHTLLGRSRKVSIKSDRKVALPEEDWVITKNTHPPLVDQETFDLAQRNLGRNARDYRGYDMVRKSIFAGVTYCARCGHALCSCGTAYKGEKEKYWYLACTHQRQGLPDRCPGTRVNYADLCELVRRELNSLIALDKQQTDRLVREVLRRFSSDDHWKTIQLQREKGEARLQTIDKIIIKLYSDNSQGRLEDDRLARMVEELQKESEGIRKQLAELPRADQARDLEENYKKFFALARQYNEIRVLDRETLLTFVERIEVGPKIYPEGVRKGTQKNQTYRQSIRIFYKFIGQLESSPLRRLPPAISQ